MLRISLLTMAIVATLAGCSSSPVEPPKSLTKVVNTFDIKQRWRYQFGEGVSDKYLRLAPVIHDGKMYNVDHTGRVLAVTMAEQNILWEFESGMSIGSPLTLVGDTLYLGTSEGYVLSIDRLSGKLNWKARVGSEVLAAPAVAKGYVVARCVNGELYALSSSNGKVIWSDRQITPRLTLRGTSTPVISDDLVLSAYDNGKLIAYNLQTGRIIWQKSISVASGRTTLERLIDIDADIVISDDIIYTVAFQGKLAAVALGSGQVLWSRDVDSYVGMAVDPYRIYLVDTNSQIWALDKSNGATHWKQDAMLRRGLTKPVLHSNYLLVGDFNGFLHWLRRDSGELVARVKLNSAEYTSPSLDETEDLDYPKSNNILATPVVTGNMLIATDRHGNTEAFEISYP
jgi:outer membrane protein assembly factor BamB